MKSYLTHREIEGLCRRFMEKIGWNKVSGRTIKSNGLAIQMIRCDQAYIKEDELPLAFEIKPGNAMAGQIKQGIGQQACFLPYRVKPYLVLSQKQWLEFKEFIGFLPWLGIVVYSVDNLLNIAQRAEERDWDNLKPFEPVTEHQEISNDF